MGYADSSHGDDKHDGTSTCASRFSQVTQAWLGINKNRQAIVKIGGKSKGKNRRKPVKAQRMRNGEPRPMHGLLVKVWLISDKGGNSREMCASIC